MKYLGLIFLLTSFSGSVFAQQDTTVLYFDKDWNEVSRDTSFYKSIMYKEGDVWKRKNYWVKSGTLQMEGAYLNPDRKKPQGTFRSFYESGSLKNTTSYEYGKRKSSNWFYESGKKKGHIDYTPAGMDQIAWDENGTEMPGYIIEKEAQFPGGMKEWAHYLERNLDANVAAAAGARRGLYPVKVQFVVDKEGNVSNVTAVEIPEGCARCGKEAVRVIKKGPKWIPAMQDNKPVIYQATQHITFQVSE